MHFTTTGRRGLSKAPSIRLTAGTLTAAVFIFILLFFMLGPGDTGPAVADTRRKTLRGVGVQAGDNSAANAQESAAPALLAAGSQVFFPYLAGQPLFYQDPAIWSSQLQQNALFPRTQVAASPENETTGVIPGSAGAFSSLTAGAQVSLFRHRFYLDEDLQQAGLVIFADTRYQVWVDGQWAGRGPARFSLTYREYDILPLGSLPAGEHVIAILVQWAPNTRRSESSTPMLKAHLQGSGSTGIRVLARTGADWRALDSDAWQPASAPVHAWNLIGPTELLDLRRLPADWYMPAFDDASWGFAAVLDPASLEPAAEYAPRSIPYLVDYPVKPVVAGTGRLSPGSLLGEFLPSTAAQNIALTATSGVTITLEILKETLPPTVSLTVDGAVPAWLPAPSERPDVYTASLPLESGSHQINLAAVPAAGMALALAPSPQSNPALQVELPFQQGLHAGHRLLLAHLQPDAAAVNIIPGADLNISFGDPPGYVVLDLGRTIHGRLSAQVNGPPGAVLDIGWDERLSSGGAPLPYPGSLHPQWNQVDSWIMDGSLRPISTLDARSGRYILIAAWGDAPIHLQQVTITEERYPAVQTGSFQSADSLLNTIWQTGVETMRPNMTDAYTDTPWRERGQWWGDAYVGILTNQAAFGDTLLWRRSLRLMADALQMYDAPGMAPNPNGTHMLDYAMLWVDSLAAYTRLTADLAEARQLYAQVSGLMQHLDLLENDTTGLLELPQLHWSQTAYIDSLGQDSRYGQSTALNALYTQALRAAAEIARAAGDAASADQWEVKAGMQREAINQHLYLPGEGRYLSTLYLGQPVSPTSHAQAWALAYGIPEASEEDRVAQALLELLSPDPANPDVNIYGFTWVLEGLARSGYTTQAVDLLKLYYGSMLGQGATTWWEQFNASNNWTVSLSHAWGAFPTWFLSSHILGARQTSPTTWEVRIPFAGGDHFTGVAPLQGAVPMRDGTLEISWQASCLRAALQVDGPAGSQGEVIIPWLPPGVALWLNGAPLREGFSGVPGTLGQGYLDADGELHLPVPASPVLVEIEPGC